jgi:hypothetical protein
MSDRFFLGYVGDPDFHDGRVVSIGASNDGVRVRIRGASGQMFVAEFGAGRIVRSNKPEGMLLYALSEFRNEPPFRKFVFANWDEDDAAALEIEAETFKVVAEE